MKTLLSHASRASFTLLAIGLFVFTSWLSYSFAGRVFPDNQFFPLFSLLAFDVAALVWLMVFIHTAEGMPQRLVALGGFIAGLLGAALMVAAETLLAGQELVQAPENMRIYAVYGLIGSIGLHLVLVYLFHLTSPEVARAITIRNVEDKITAKSLTVLEQRADEIADQVADSLALDALNQTLLQLGKGAYIDSVAMPQLVHKTQGKPLKENLPAAAKVTASPTAAVQSPNGREPVGV